MRRLGMAILMATTAGTVWAEDAYIQLESWRAPAEAAAKAQDWAARLPDIVTWQAGTWWAVGIGPIAGDADARLDALKAARAIPRDAYLVRLGEGVAVTPAAGSPAPDTGTDTATGTTADTGTNTAAAEPAVPAPQTLLRLEAFPTRAEADAALARWREVLPGASLWELPTGWFAIAAGPVDPAQAGDWLAAWKGAGAVPADAFATTDAELGTVLAAGAPLDPALAPPAPPVMPPIDVVQDVLHWAGRYEGAIDGRPGPQTTAAIAAEMAAQGIAPGTRHGEAIALQALLARRAAWTEEMGLAPLTDAATGLTLTVPADRLEFLREDRGLSIYGPREGSGAALILFNQPGGRAEMEDLAGFITALGWVGHPVRDMGPAGFTLDGRNDTHVGHAEGRIAEGRVRGFVLIWPAADAENAPRLAAIAAETLAPAPAGEAPGAN